MKYLLLFCLVIALAGAVRPSNISAPAANEPAGAEQLKKMIGVWALEGRIRASPGSEFTALNGKSTIEQHFSTGQVREVFELGGSFKGEVYLNYSEAHKRFELFQIDVNSSRGSSVFLTGELADKRLRFKGFENFPQWGMTPSLDIKWEYAFFDDGTFTHEIYVKDQKGDFYLQSDYHYVRADKKQD